MPDALADAFSQAQSVYNTDQESAEHAAGQIKTAQEQDQYQQRIDAQPPAGGFWHGVEQVPAGLASGAIHGVSEMLQSGNELATWESTKMADIGNAIGLPHANTSTIQSVGTAVDTGAQRAANAVSPAVNDTAGRISAAIGQFLPAFIPADRGLEAVGIASKLARGLMAGSIAQGVAFNPHDSRLSNLIQEAPELRNPVTAFLASQAGDSDALGRLKNAIEGLGVGAVSDGFLSILKGMRATAGVAETAKALEESTPTELRAAPAAEPQVKPEEAEQVPPQPKPYEPPTLDKGDTAHPGAGQEIPPEQPEVPREPGEPAPEPEPQHPMADKAGTFSPQLAAKLVMSLDPKMAEQVRGYFADGRYADAATALLDKTHQNIDWDAMSDGANLKATFAAMETHLGDAIRTHYGVTPVTQDQIVQLAKDVGETGAGDVTRLHQALTEGAAGPGGLAARITSAYGMMIGSARHLQELAGAARDLDPATQKGTEALTAFQKQLELHSAIVGQVRRSSSEIGRALWAHRALKASSEWASSKFNDITASELGPKALKRFANDIADGNLRDVNTAARKAGGNKIVNVVKEIALNGMLSGPKTQLANIVGNGFNGLLKNAEWYLAGAIGNVRGTLMSTGEHATIRAAIAHSWGQVMGLKAAARIAGKSLLKEPDVWASSGRPVTKSIQVSTEGRTGLNLTAAKAINITGQVIRYPGRLMGTVDTFNAAAGERGDLYAHSYLQSAREADAQGLVGDDRSKFLKSRQAELIANPTTALAKHAKDAGLYQSFQEAAHTHLGHSFASFMADNPVLKLIVSPFVHRPLNILRQGMMDYTPLGLASKSVRGQLAGNDADTDVAIARMVLGTSVLLGGYHLAESGHIVGTQPGVKNTGSLDRIPPDSVRLNGKWYQFSRLDPVGQWLGMSADFHQLVSDHYNPSDDATTDHLGLMARAATQALSESMLDKTFMGSFVRIADAASSAATAPTAAVNAMQEFIDSNAGKLIPYSGALRSAAEGVDSTERSNGGDGVNAMWNELKSNLPGLSKSLTPRLDILGRPITRTPNYSWNPFAGAPEAADQMDQELAKLAFAVRMPKNNLNGIQLDPKQYAELIHMSTQTPIEGRTLQQTLSELTSSDQWKSLGTSEDGGVMLRTQLARGVIDAYYDSGKQMFEQKHPEFMQALVRAYQQKAQMIQPRQ